MQILPFCSKGCFPRFFVPDYIMFPLFFTSRNWRYEQDLASLLWKIDYKDINIKLHVSQYQSAANNLPMTRVGGFCFFSFLVDIVVSWNQKAFQARYLGSLLSDTKGTIVNTAVLSFIESPILDIYMSGLMRLTAQNTRQWSRMNPFWSCHILVCWAIKTQPSPLCLVQKQNILTELPSESTQSEK